MNFSSTKVTFDTVYSQRRAWIDLPLRTTCSLSSSAMRSHICFCRRWSLETGLTVVLKVCQHSSKLLRVTRHCCLCKISPCWTFSMSSCTRVLPHHLISGWFSSVDSANWQIQIEHTQEEAQYRLDSVQIELTRKGVNWWFCLMECEAGDQTGSSGAIWG